MWTKVYFNKQNIEHQTDRAVLINCPNKSSYAGYKFWHPSKLVREEGHNGYLLSFSATDDWEFKVFKTYKKLPNKEVLLELEDMIDMFDQSTKPSGDNESYLIVDEPKKVNKEVEVDDSLKR